VLAAKRFIAPGAGRSFSSTPYLRQQGHSDPAHHVDDEKNEQKGSKNAATNIHLSSPMICVALLSVGSVGAVWAVAHHRGVAEMERPHLPPSLEQP
jgi:hypothetical protein